MLNELNNRQNTTVIAYDTKAAYVTDNLCFTPSQMMEHAQSGIPIAGQSDPSQFYDGDTTRSMSIDPVFTRGFEINDAWNLERSSRSKVTTAYNNYAKPEV